MILCKLAVSWLVDCWLKLNKMIWNLNKWLKSSTNGKRIRLFHIWTLFNLFWFRFRCAWLWLAEKFLQKWRWFFCFVVATRLSCKTMCTVTAKQHNCRLLVLKRNIQNVAASFALFTVVETSRFIGWNVNTRFISTRWTTHISDSLDVVHTQFFFSIFGWLKWEVIVVCWVTSSSSSSKEKPCFVCFGRLYVLLQHKRNFVNKQPGSTLSTTINGSRGGYITTNRFTFLFVETILASTIHISNNILNWFWILFKKVNPLTKWQKRGICLIIERNIAHLTDRRALRALLIASAKRFKSLFVQAKYTWKFCIWTMHVPNENNSAIVISTITGECTTHCNCSRLFHTCLQRNIGSCRDGDVHDG